MNPVLQYVDSAYLCFEIPHQAISQFAQKLSKVLYLNAEKGSLCLEELPRTIWTIRPFNESSFYIEVTLAFDRSPVYLSIAKIGKFMLTSYATDSTLFTTEQGKNGLVLKTVSSRDASFFFSIEKNIPLENIAPLKYIAIPFSDESFALTFSFVHESRCHEPIVSLESIQYIQRCEEYFLREPLIRLDPNHDESAWKVHDLKCPEKELAQISHMDEDALWITKEPIRSGTVFCTHQSALFGQLFCYADQIAKLHNICGVNWKSEIPKKQWNVCISALHLGHPDRSFPVYVIFALENIPGGSPLFPQICLPGKDICGGRNSVVGWPQTEPYFHGIGRHTCGPPVVSYPLNMLAIRDCPQIGVGQKELVARNFISKGTIFSYTGVPSDRSSPYSWYTSAGYNILGGGIMRYANIYFGFASSFNAILLEVPFVLSEGSKQPILGVALLQDVQAEEPILVRSYGRDADFEILRRIVCKGNYLEIERFPEAMKTQGLDSNEQWYLPGDLVAIKSVSSTGTITDIKLFSLCKLTSSGAAMGVQLKRKYGVEFILMKGTKAERLKLEKCILLLPDEDYTITHQKGDNTNAYQRNIPEHSDTMHECTSSNQKKMLPRSWQFSENRGPISDSALEKAMTSDKASNLRSRNRINQMALLTVRLSQSVSFLLFSCLEKSVTTSLPKTPKSAIIHSRLGTMITEPHKMGSLPEITKESKQKNTLLDLSPPSIFDSFSCFLNESASFV